MISESMKMKMEQAINKMASSSLRTLCLAYKKVSRSNDFESKDDKGIFNI
jgi:magnesium-transporting ATPase (P-type)